ncbi:alpha/beta fold hydrolase [Streptomyces sp. NBC_00448]|uniref:alpha/beta fold hydrolase n=1 Tax=Streptomyces sp. NBC_00448 TaxID=2903652 RepID=UPI002E1D156B
MSEEPGLLMTLGRRSGPLDSVLIHPAGGGLGQYLRLARRLARHGTVYGIRAAGLLPGERPERSVPRMTAAYRELLDALPRPPALLAGWSLGGILAWELAAEAAAAGTAGGTPPPAVVMIDSHPELEPDNALLRSHPLDSIEHSAGGLSSGFEPALLRSTAAAHLTAARAHRVRQPSDTPTLLLACASPDREAQIARWRSLATRLTVRDLDCGHFDVFTPPHHGQLLRHIQPFIDRLTAAR